MRCNVATSEWQLLCSLAAICSDGDSPLHCSNPNKQSGPGDYTELPVWPQYDRELQQYMTMTINEAPIGHGPRRRQCAFWKD